MKRLSVIQFLIKNCLLFAVLLLCLQVSASAEKSGTWGDLTWELDEQDDEEILTFSGSGDMNFSWSNTDQPWGHHITKVIINSGITSIGDWVFYDCKELESISIPDSVTTIFNAFPNCQSLRSISISKNVTYIDSAFEGCTSLESISVSSDNQYYSSLNGTLFDKEKTILYRYPSTKSGSYSVPDTVSTIYNGAFRQCSKLTGIDIPQRVTSIGESAFANCTALTYITIPDHIERIEDFTFTGCSSLETINIPDSVTSIGRYAFCQCGIKSIVLPQNVKTIEPFTFSYSKLQNITWPTGLLHIENNAFEGCELSTVIIPESVKTIGSGAFYHCSNLESITLPPKVTTLEYALFSNCYNLHKVTIQATSLDIASSNVFYCCPYNIMVIIPNNLQSIDKKDTTVFDNSSDGVFVTDIGSQGAIAASKADCFFRPKGAKGYRLRYLFTSDTITDTECQITDTYFEMTDNIPFIRIPSGVTKLDMYNFCMTPTCVFIPQSVRYTSLSSENVKAVLYDGTSAQWEALVKNSGDNLLSINVRFVRSTLKLPESITSIQDEAFSGIENALFEIPSTLTHISSTAFAETAVIICEAKSYAETRCHELGLFVITK